MTNQDPTQAPDDAAPLLDHIGAPLGELCLEEGEDGVSLGDFFLPGEHGETSKADFCKEKPE